MTFRSKLDVWLAVVMSAGAALCVVGVVATVIATSLLTALALSPVLLIGAALPLWLMRSTVYRLDEAELHIQSGPFHWLVPLRDVRAVTPTRNPLSSPALSLDRLRIDYGSGNSIMISPADTDTFLRELEQRRQALRR